MSKAARRFIAGLAVAAATVVLAAGCSASKGSGSSSSFAVGSTEHAISVGGVTRTFLLYRPANLTSPAPLVVMMHGGFGTAAQAEKSYHWDEEATRGHFLVAYPDGLNHAWNTGGGCCGQPGRSNVDDVGFITKMVASIGQQVPLDAHRIYGTGISNGGIMAYTLGCETSIFAAIGPDSATMLGPCPSPKPLSVIHIHGTADTRIRYNGGVGAGVGRINGPAIPALNASWRRIDGCSAPHETTSATVTTSLATCPLGRAVELVTISGAGHQWPGAVSKPVAQRLLGTDPPSTALNATDVIWRFFATHPK